jgi:hypothetical protein
MSSQWSVRGEFVEEYPVRVEIFSSHSRLVVGEGNWVRFWNDQWCRETKLKEDFPELYSIAREKDASVAANVEFLGGMFQWNVIFGREIHD